MQSEIEKDDLKYILERNISWIENCDSKASMALGFLGALFTIFFVSDYISEINTLIHVFLKTNGWYAIIFISAAGLGAGTIIVGCFFLVMVLYARTSPISPTLPKQKLSLIFFADIAKNADYQSAVFRRSKKELMDDYALQIQICAAICNKKFWLYKKGVALSFIGLAVFMLTTLLLVVFSDKT